MLLLKIGYNLNIPMVLANLLFKDTQKAHGAGILFLGFFEIHFALMSAKQR